MNDYAHGGLEALAWVLGLIEDSDDVNKHDVLCRITYQSSLENGRFITKTDQESSELSVGIGISLTMTFSVWHRSQC
jgi:hypothetical protein